MNDHGNKLILFTVSFFAMICICVTLQSSDNDMLSDDNSWNLSMNHESGFTVLCNAPGATMQIELTHGSSIISFVNRPTFDTFPAVILPYTMKRYPAGKYNIYVSCKGYIPQLCTASLPPTHDDTLRVSLQPDYLNIVFFTAEVQGQLELDGKIVSKTNGMIQDSVIVSPGFHKFRFIPYTNCYLPVEQEIEYIPGEHFGDLDLTLPETLLPKTFKTYAHHQWSYPVTILNRYVVLNLKLDPPTMRVWRNGSVDRELTRRHHRPILSDPVKLVFEVPEGNGWRRIGADSFVVKPEVIGEPVVVGSLTYTKTNQYMQRIYSFDLPVRKVITGSQPHSLKIRVFSLPSGEMLQEAVSGDTLRLPEGRWRISFDGETEGYIEKTIDLYGAPYADTVLVAEFQKSDKIATHDRKLGLRLQRLHRLGMQIHYHEGNWKDTSLPIENTADDEYNLYLVPNPLSLDRLDIMNNVRYQYGDSLMPITVAADIALKHWREIEYSVFPDSVASVRNCTDTWYRHRIEFPINYVSVNLLKTIYERKLPNERLENGLNIFWMEYNPLMYPLSGTGEVDLPEGEMTGTARHFTNLRSKSSWAVGLPMLMIGRNFTTTQGWSGLFEEKILGEFLYSPNMTLFSWIALHAGYIWTSNDYNWLLRLCMGPEFTSRYVHFHNLTYACIDVAKNSYRKLNYATWIPASGDLSVDYISHYGIILSFTAGAYFSPHIFFDGDRRKHGRIGWYDSKDIARWKKYGGDTPKSQKMPDSGFNDSFMPYLGITLHFK